LALFAIYQQIRDLRERDDMQINEVGSLIHTYLQDHNSEWLVDYELCELALRVGADRDLVATLQRRLSDQHADAAGQTVQLIQYGLDRLKNMETQ
jgi:hypothetical protein